MLDNAFRIAVDPLFPHPKRHTENQIFENRFELVFSDFEREVNDSNSDLDESDPDSEEDNY
jgi:hypothetical protein